MLTPRKFRLMLYASILLVVASLSSISVLLKLPEASGVQPLPTLASLTAPTDVSVALSSNEDVGQNAPDNTEITVTQEVVTQEAFNETSAIEAIPTVLDLTSQENSFSFVRLSNFVEENNRTDASIEENTEEEPSAHSITTTTLLPTSEAIVTAELANADSITVQSPATEQATPPTALPQQSIGIDLFEGQNLLPTEGTTLASSSAVRICASPQMTFTPGQSVRIMPLGDSITQSNSSYNSYRRRLWQLLQNAGHNVDFVGSLRTNYQGDPPNPDFDLDHEGHWGWRADQILAQVSGWTAASQPDIVLLHVGTNDIFQGQDVASTITEIGQIIDTMRATNPNIVILLAKVIPHNRSDYPSLEPLNTALPALVDSKNTTQSPVILVDQSRGFDAATDTFDAVHPNALGEEKMAYRWYGALLSVLASPTANSGKPRLLVTSDILGSDPDDEQSFVRLLSYSNEFDIAGLIASSTFSGTVRPEGFSNIIDQYALVRDNLILHDAGFPTATYLQDIVRPGQPNASLSANITDTIGLDKDTLASDWIIAQVDANDPRPLNITSWGGTADIAQALWRVQNDRTPAEVTEFISKIRIHAINDQDTTGSWIRTNFPSLFYILNLYPAGPDSFQSVFRGMYIGGDTSTLNSAWVRANVTSGHGALGAAYPPDGAAVDGIKEGDSPSWFYFLPNGLGAPEHPDWGSWGGRFELIQNSLWRDAEDTIDGVTSGRATVWRWRDAYQNDFQARMDWQVQPYSGANHNPVATVSGALSRTVTPGTTVILDASSSSDPDGNVLSYKWFVYPEAGTYSGTVDIVDPTMSSASLVAPVVDSPETIHVILAVTDNGTPTLTSYQRIVITVNPDGTTEPTGQPPLAIVDGPYTVARGDSINISAPGVLENDSDPEDDALTIDDYTQPTHGTLTLEPDGSFSYTHDGSEANTDSFTYTITDGNLNYDTATVNLSVMPNLTFTPALFDIEVEVGTTNTTSFAVTGDDSNSMSITLTTSGESWLSVPDTVTDTDINSLIIDATGLELGTYTATVTASATDYSDGVLPITITVVDALSSGADVSLFKTAPAQRNYNDSLAYNLRVHNDGPESATDVTVIDTLPDNVSFISASPASANCTHSNGTVTCNVGSLAANTQVDIRIEVQINIQAEIYSVTTTNYSPFSVDNLSLTHQFPDNLTFIGVEPSDLCTENALTITCNFGLTDTEVTQSATVTYFADEGSVLSNVASVSANEPDPNMANNTAGASTTITSEPVSNEPPVITQIEDQTNYDDDDVSLSIDAEDAENDILTYAASGLPDGLTIDPQTGQISGIVTAEALTNSPYAVTISVDDGHNAPVTMAFTWAIQQRIAVISLSLVDSATDTVIGPLRDGDVLNLFEVGNELSILAETDPETVGSVQFVLNGDTNFSTDNDVPYALLGDTDGDYVSWTPTVGQYTLEAVPYSQADTSGYNGISQSISFEIIDQANFVPEITSIQDQTLDEGEQVVLNIQATDAENDAITLSAAIEEDTTATPLANFNLQDNGDGTGTLTLEPQPGSAGTYTATVSAADATGTGSTTFSITVTVPNQLPTADAGPAQTIDDTDDNGTESVTLDGSGSNDPDGTITQYDWSENEIVIATGVQPTLDLTVGEHVITLTVTDDRGDMVSDTVIITINAANNAPTADAGNNQTLVDTDRNGSEQVTLDGSASSDSDGTITSYVWSDSSGQLATGAQSTVTLPVGIHFITLTVTDDGGKQSTDTITVIIQTPPPSPRVTDGLLTLYEFNEGSGNTVADTSGFGTPMNLTISNTGNVVWGTGALDITGSTVIQSSGPATKVINAVRSTNAITVEAWIQPDNVNQEGPARVVGISGNPSNRNVTLGQGLWGTQPRTVFDTRLRTRSSTPNGIPSLSTPANTATTNLTHVVFTHAANGTSTMYVNGVAVATSQMGTNLGNWDTKFPLVLANEPTGDRPWLGAFHLVAIYNRSLTSTEVTQNYNAGSQGDAGGATTSPTAVAGPDQVVTDSDNNGTESITLDGSSSIPGDNPIALYEWYENGAVIATSMQPTMTLSSGIHTLELLVTDSGGNQSVDEVLITVNRLPVANAGPDQTARDTDNSGSEAITLDGSASTDIGGSIANYVWYENGNQIATGSQPQINLTVGVHTVDLTVTDNHGATDTDTVTMTVEPGNALPTANAGPDQTVKDLDENDVETITLNGSGSDPDGTIVNYIWSENDIEIATGQQANVDLAIGTHTLTLTVTDNEGGQGTDTVVIEVQLGNTPPIANAGPDQTVNDADGNGDENITLDGSASSDAENTIIAWEWSLNGTPLASGAQPTVTLPIGTHTITLTVTVDGGSITQATDTVTITVVETNAAPVAHAGPDQTVPDNDANGSEVVTLNGTASTDDNGIASYVWSENGAQIATGPQPQVTLALGTHTLMLVVTDAQGRQANDTVTITVVNNLAPVANAGADQMLEDANLNTTEPITLNGTGSFDPDGTIANYEWSINGTVVGLGPQPNIVLSLGLHTVNLTVTDSNGAQASDTMTVEVFSVPIANAGPDQSLEDTDDSGTETVTLDGSGSTLAYGSIIAYDWSLNGVSIATTPVANVELPVGVHNVTLTITADRGITTTATDMVTITITKPNQRVTNGLLALYEFNEGSGNTVADTSGFGTPMNLTISNTGNVTWGSGALNVNSSTVIQSSGPATKLISSVKSTNEITIEAWIQSNDLTQGGPARVVSISGNPSNRNITLGQGLWDTQPRDLYDMRLRTRSTSPNGVPSLSTQSGTITTNLTHVVLTHAADGMSTIYVNGVALASHNQGSDLGNWDPSFPLVLANEPTGDRPWLGTFHLVAIYNRALSSAEVTQSYQSGP